MSVKITTKENQAKGVFAGGAILENKPIGFPQDGGGQKPYSNLFYWANATTDLGGLIGEHPHKMFEIMSFVLEGEIEHYDSKFNRWLSLKAGDVQIIRSRGGITHAERLLENSRIFQIWFDPNIRESMLKEATYNDYKAEEFEVEQINGVAVKNYVGGNAPVLMDSEGVEIKEMTFSESVDELKLDSSKIHSFYMFGGDLKVNDQIVNANDFVVVENEDKLRIEGGGKLFLISVPQKLSYQTYKELVKY